MNAMKRLLLSASLFGWACVSPPPVSNWTPALEPFDREDPSFYKSRPTLLVADCQLFNIFTQPQAQRNLSSKTMADSAIRPPQLNLFADEVLRWIVTEGTEDAEVILHLGDAIDLACEGELRAFVKTMTASGKPWLLAPGNHDCFYMGNYDPPRREEWLSACYGAGEILSKDVFLRLYVASLLAQRGPGFDDLARSLGLADVRDEDLAVLAEKIPLQHSWEAPTAAGALLDAIAWNIDTKRPWRSFLLQRADIGGRGPDGLPCWAILMDSCQYWERPIMLPNAWKSYPVALNAGLSGEMLADQLRIVREWVEELSRLQGFTVLMSHHPLNRIAPRSRSSLKWLWREHRFKVASYVSAHTHKGHFAYHPFGDDWEGLEINIGSTTDWPMEWRTLRYFGRPGTGGKRGDFYVETKRFALADVLENRGGHFLPEWEIPVGAVDDYRAYARGAQSTGTLFDFYFTYHMNPPFMTPPPLEPRKPSIETEHLVKSGCLRTYQRMVELFPTSPDHNALWPDGCTKDEDVIARIDATLGDGVALDDKIRLLMQLKDFDESRASYDPETGRDTSDELLKFKVCQAVWASRFESTQGRRLIPSDQLVRVFVPRTYTDLEEDPVEDSHEDVTEQE